MSEFPSLPFFVDAYLADAGHLTDAEHGRYLLILCQMWISPECRLPQDDSWLMRRFRRDAMRLHDEIWPIINEFCQTDGNWITQKRLRKEWLWCQTKRKRNSDSAKALWDKKKSGYKRNAPNPIPNPIPTLNLTTDSESKHRMGRSQKAMRPTRDEEFEKFKQFYPKRRGANPWAPAQKVFQAAVQQGADPADIVAGLKASAGFDRDKIGTEYIPQAVKWLRDKRWLDTERTVPEAERTPIGWKPGMPTSEELKAHYRRISSNGSAQGNQAEHSEHSKPEGDGFFSGGEGVHRKTGS